MNYRIVMSVGSWSRFYVNGMTNEGTYRELPTLSPEMNDAKIMNENEVERIMSIIQIAYGTDARVFKVEQI